MPKKYTMPFKQYHSMFGSKSSTEVIKFLSSQKIGKIELVTSPWQLPTQEDKSVTKFIFDLENNKYTKLVNGKVEFNERGTIGELITDFYDMSKSNSNDYSSVIFYRRTNVPGTAGKFSNEALKSKVLSIVREEVRRVLRIKRF